MHYVKALILLKVLRVHTYMHVDLYYWDCEDAFKLCILNVMVLILDMGMFTIKLLMRIL